MGSLGSEIPTTWDPRGYTHERGGGALHEWRDLTTVGIPRRRRSKKRRGWEGRKRKRRLIGILEMGLQGTG